MNSSLENEVEEKRARNLKEVARVFEANISENCFPCLKKDAALMNIKKSLNLALECIKKNVN